MLFTSQYTDVCRVRSISGVMLCNRKLGPIPGQQRHALNMKHNVIVKKCISF